MKKYKLLEKMIDMIAKRQSFRVSADALDSKNEFIAEFHIGDEIVTILAETNDAAGNEFCAVELFDAGRAIRTVNSAIDASGFEFDEFADIFHVKKIKCEFNATAEECSFAPQMTTQEVFLEYFYKF